MDLYEILAEDYRAIFPSSREKLDFAESFLEGRPGNLLDMGCACGEFTCHLAAPGRHVTGIDPDGAMIRVAREKSSPLRDEAVQFRKADMLSFLSEAPAEYYDGLFCMGNTLVYLDGEEELKRLLALSLRVLKDRGLLVLQFLNYGNRLIGPGYIFPSAESERIRFERSYRASEEPGKLDFLTMVSDKTSGETHRDRHRHYPFLCESIDQAARETGFSHVYLYGGYDRKPPEGEDFFHLAVMRKGYDENDSL